MDALSSFITHCEWGVSKPDSYTGASTDESSLEQLGFPPGSSSVSTPLSPEMISRHCSEPILFLWPADLAKQRA